MKGEASSICDVAIVSLSSSVLNKLSLEEQEKFEMTEFKRATNEIEHWKGWKKYMIFLELKIQIWQEKFM